MLPAAPAQAGSLTEVMPSLSASMRGEANALRLPAVQSAVVVLIDGLGVLNLRAAAGHARFLSAQSARRLETVFPSTTAVALSSLTTGRWPGEHGMLGYRVLDHEHDRLVNLLSGWDDGSDPTLWQRRPTIFSAQSQRSVVISSARYEHSGFTKAALSGAAFVGAESLDDRMDAVVREVRSGPSLVYCYVPELDQAAHAYGTDSQQWLTALENVDAALQSLAGRLPKGVGVAVTADHGIVDVPEHRHLELDAAMLAPFRHVGGEPRGLQLWFHAEVVEKQRSDILDALRTDLHAHAWVFSRDEAVRAGLLGTVDSSVIARFGDLVIAAKSGAAFYHADVEPASRRMIGQHGSWTDQERLIPLIGFGAYQNFPGATASKR